MKKNFIIGSLIFILLFILSCTKPFLNKKLETSNKKENYEYLWDQIDKKYSFFDLKGIDWLEIKKKYDPLINESLTDEEFFKILSELVNELKDGHANLVSPFDRSRYDIYRIYEHQSNDRTILTLFPNLQRTSDFHHSMVENENIAYIRFKEFDMLSENDIDYVLNKYQNTNGLIIDIRSNGGGVGVIAKSILSRFTNKTITVGYEQMRNGPLHNDFSDAAPIIIEPKGTFFNKPIIVLTDRRSYSAATYFALACKSFDNITLLGDTTGGGAGMPNGGELPNGWTYRFSITRALDIDKRNYAEQGVPPDIYAKFDWSNLNRDEIIEKAIELLK